MEHRGENIALVVLALAVALIVAYAIVVRPDASPAAAALLPEGDKPALAAVIRATGQECDRVCEASVLDPLLASARLRVSCSVAAKNIACDAAHAFEITVKPAPEPSR